MDPLTLMLASQAAGAVTGGIQTLVEQRYNSPKKQIQRLRSAGIHPNAFYEMGSTGNINQGPDLMRHDPSQQFGAFTQALIDQDIHNAYQGTTLDKPKLTGHKFTDIGLMAKYGQDSEMGTANLYRAEKLAGINQANSQAWQNKALTLTENALRGPRESQIRQDTATSAQNERTAAAQEQSYLADIPVKQTTAELNRVKANREQYGLENIDPEILTKTKAEARIAQIDAEYARILKDLQVSQGNATFTLTQKQTEKLQEDIYKLYLDQEFGILKNEEARVLIDKAKSTSQWSQYRNALHEAGKAGVPGAATADFTVSVLEWLANTLGGSPVMGIIPTTGAPARTTIKGFK